MLNVQHHYSLSYTQHAASIIGLSQTALAYDSSAASPGHGLWSAVALVCPPSHMSKVRSFDWLRSFHGDLAATNLESICHGEPAAPFPASSSSPIQVPGWHHRDREQAAHDRAFMQSLSAPVDVVHPYPRRSNREEKRRIRGNGWSRRILKDEEEQLGAETMLSTDEEEEEEEEYDDEEEQAAEKEEEEERLPPHEEVARQWAAATSCGGAAFSLCQGVGRTLKGRDLCSVRNAILKQTGFIS